MSNFLINFIIFSLFDRYMIVYLNIRPRVLLNARPQLLSTSQVLFFRSDERTIDHEPSNFLLYLGLISTDHEMDF